MLLKYRSKRFVGVSMLFKKLRIFKIEKNRLFDFFFFYRRDLKYVNEMCKCNYLPNNKIER